MVNILDSFEDGYSSEYDGAVNAFSTSTNHAFDGSYALQTDASESAISRTDIQVSYDGQIPFGARLLADELVGPDNDSNYPLKTIDFFFAVQTAGEQYNGSYVISTNFDTEELSIGVYDSDANLTELGVTSVTAYEADVWYEVAVTQWTTAGDITVEVRDENGSTLGTISVNDDSYSKGGIGWGVGENFSSAQVWYDYAYEVVSLERNSTLSTDSSITSKRASSKTDIAK